MSTKIGFAILSYDHPEQLLRLVKTLTAMFNAPPIACHHNFTQCSFRPEMWPNNVRFVIPHIDTKWGHISVPLATLKAFRQLRAHAQPDWFVLLSASDYPVLCADEIVRDLENTQYDAFLDHREIPYDDKSPPERVEEHGFDRPEWIKVGYARYCCHHIMLPYFSRKRLYSGRFPFWKNQVFVRNPTINRMLNWFQLSMKIYGGEFWFQANRKAVHRLLDCSLDKLVSYYHTRHIPEESFFHTALCNHTDLKVCAKNRRYSDWTLGGDHPKWLEVSDVPLIIASRAHFARKFRPDGMLQEFVDKTVLRL